MMNKKSKKLSKSALLRADQKINVALRKKFEAKILDKERLKADSEDIIIPTKIKEFNAESLQTALNGLKGSGVDTDSSVFADMERVLNNNESIRELVDIKNIRLKTKVTDEQHKIITVLYGCYKTLLLRYNIDYKGLRTILDEFIEIAPSIEGKRAEQFVVAHQAIAQSLANANAGHNTNQIRPDDNSGKT